MDIPLKMLDRKLAMDRVGGDEILLKEVARLFLDDCPRALHNLNDAIAAGDAKRLEREAHSLKGAVATFGADPVTQAASELEALGKQGDLQAASVGLQRLQEALDILKPELSTLAGG